MEIDGICFESIDTGGGAKALQAMRIGNADWQFVLTDSSGLQEPESDWLLCMYSDSDWQPSGYVRSGENFPLGVASAINELLPIAQGRTFASEFADYPACDFPPVPAGWRDSSWHNDTCPSMTFGETSGVWLHVFCDYADKSLREYPDSDAPRFSMMTCGVEIAAADSWPEMLAHMEREALALQFALDLRAELTDSEWQEMRKRNMAYPADVCASHDFRDSNMIMQPAFESLTGREMRADSQRDADLWNQAWEIAGRFYLRADSPEVTSEINRQTAIYHEWLAARPEYPPICALELEAELTAKAGELGRDIEWLKAFNAAWDSAMESDSAIWRTVEAQRKAAALADSSRCKPILHHELAPREGERADSQGAAIRSNREWRDIANAALHERDKARRGK